MERLDVHGEVCEIVVESATIVAILESDSKTDLTTKDTNNAEAA